MKVSRRYLALASIGLFFLGAIAVTLWMRHVPEPKYEGVPFSVYLDQFGKDRKLMLAAHRAVKEQGDLLAPYLAKQFDEDPLRELAFKVQPYLPQNIADMLPNPKILAQRRSMAAALLPEAGTNRVLGLRRLIEITEAEHPNYSHNFVRAIGMIAPGTEYEERGKKIILNVIEDTGSNRDMTMRRMEFHLLGGFRGKDTVAVLIAKMKEPGFPDICVESLVKIGAEAVPELKKVAETESGHIRPATLALEKIEKKLQEEKSK